MNIKQWLAIEFTSLEHFLEVYSTLSTTEKKKLIKVKRHRNNGKPYVYSGNHRNRNNDNNKL